MIVTIASIFMIVLLIMVTIIGLLTVLNIDLTNIDLSTFGSTSNDNNEPIENEWLQQVRDCVTIYHQSNLNESQYYSCMNDVY